MRRVPTARVAVRSIYISLVRFVVPVPYISADFDRIKIDIDVVWLSFVGGELDV